ncbi:RNA polymerase sigma factor [Winogradskyella bathintestinalis]|uniref:RNA polymerase sigma factor n=1 Tax=Winogradskyella bathintestinalis TaxID=3035208 RepID=A0ABT7ZW02_9FLAO|nr:sigma-70 family RNA polymerase sigma factor [Winogradskyella bathintestinalis]MDN3493014.1 sigma-70 family RNA polymerase sigma factor [Winogradskyella bathintestinalis]
MKIEDLVEQFQNKDEKAFKKLYEMYAVSIRGVIFNIVKNNAITDELLQDTFIKAWQNAASYSSKKGRFFTWILNIARNSAIDTVRSKSFKKAKNNLNSDAYEHLLTHTYDLDQSTDAIGIKKFLPKISAKRCEIIELLFIKGYTQKEVSQHLKISISTVKTRKRNGIKSLRLLVL